jgi:hypothetical protein
MPQLIENKRNHPILIANFEPNEIATKSGQKTKIQTRKHRAGDAARKVGIQSRRHCGINQNEDLVSEDNDNKRRVNAAVTRLCELTQGVHICRGYSLAGRNFSSGVAPRWSETNCCRCRSFREDRASGDGMNWTAGEDCYGFPCPFFLRPERASRLLPPR